MYNVSTKPNVTTKRMALSVAARFYDLLKLISPAVPQLDLLHRSLGVAK